MGHQEGVWGEKWHDFLGAGERRCTWATRESQEGKDWNWTWRWNEGEWWWNWIHEKWESNGKWSGDYWEWLGHNISDRCCDVSLRSDGGRAVLSPTFNSSRSTTGAAGPQPTERQEKNLYFENHHNSKTCFTNLHADLGPAGWFRAPPGLALMSKEDAWERPSLGDKNKKKDV